MLDQRTIAEPERHHAEKEALKAECAALNPIIQVIVSALPSIKCSAIETAEVKTTIKLVKDAVASAKLDSPNANQEKGVKESLSWFNKAKSKLDSLTKSGNAKLEKLMKPLKAAIDRFIVKFNAFYNKIIGKFAKNNTSKIEKPAHRDEHRFEKHINKRKL